MPQTVRETLDELTSQHETTTVAIVDDMSSYFRRQRDHALLKGEIKKRFGTGIKSEPDPNNSEATIDTYAIGDFHKKVDIGIVEAFASGYGPKIADSTATLFTEPSQRIELRNGDADTEDAQKLLGEYRRAGGYSGAVVEADGVSVEIGSSAIFTSMFANRLRYQVLTRADIQFYFSQTIEHEGERRPTDTSDIDDASVVIIRLSPVGDGLNWNWLAIYGQSNIYENGRYVQYQAPITSSVEVPAVGAKDAFDFKMFGEIANPMTFFANENPDMDVPEYPITIIDGGTTRSSDIMPVSTSLYEDCLTIDANASRLLSSSSDCARGTIGITRDKNAGSEPLPETLNGAVVFYPGQAGERLDQTPDGPLRAMEVLDALMVHNGAGYAVPEYLITSSSKGFASSESGEALKIKAQPMIKKREKRIDKNRLSVLRLFNIEKANISMFGEADDATVQKIVDSEQFWDAGKLTLPENKKEEAQRIVLLKKEGVLDMVAAIQEYFKLPTEELAMAKYNQMKDRAKEFPDLAPKEEPKRTFGLGNGPRRTNAQ